MLDRYKVFYLLGERSDRAVPLSGEEPRNPSPSSARGSRCSAHLPRCSLRSPWGGRCFLGAAVQADFAACPEPPKAKPCSGLLRIRPCCSWAESGPECPLDDGTRHWSTARAAVQSQPGRMLRSHHHHPRWDEGAAGTDPARVGGWGAGQHPPACSMNVVSPGSSGPVLPGLGKPRWVSEGTPLQGCASGSGRACWWGFCFLLCLHSSVWMRRGRKPECSPALVDVTHGGGVPRPHTLGTTNVGQPGFGTGPGGHTLTLRGVRGSPSAAPCTPAAFQAKPPPTCCVSGARSRTLEKSFLPCAAPKLRREAQHLPLTMRLTRCQTPSGCRLLSGMLLAPRPPHSPVCPRHRSCCPPGTLHHPFAGTYRWGRN